MSARLELDIGQFMLDTMAFTPEVIGAYVRVLVAYRSTGPLNVHALQRISGLDAEGWDWAMDHIAPLFDLKDGHWHNAAVDEQIAKTGRLRKNAAKASAAAVIAKNEGGSPSQVKAPAFDAGTAGSNPAPPAIEEDEEVFDSVALRDAKRARHAPAPPIEIGQRVQTTVIQMGAPPPDEIGEGLSREWSLPPEEIVQCRGEGYSSVEIADVIDSFKRYHIAAGTMSTDWNASWRKWWERKKPTKVKAKPRVQVSRQPAEDSDGTEA